MTDDELLVQLVRLAGDLFAREGTDPAELNEVLGILVRALRRGQPPDRICLPSEGARPWPRPETAIDTAALAMMRQLIAQPDDGAGPAPVVLRRTHPALAALAPGGLPGWLRGRRRSRGFGPFLEATTRSVWFDVWDGGTGLKIVREGPAGPEPILVVSNLEDWTGPRLCHASIHGKAGSKSCSS